MSGERLCHLLNLVKPASVPTVHRSKDHPSGELPLPLRIENVRAYLSGCRTLGMATADLFAPSDLIDGTDLSRGEWVSGRFAACRASPAAPIGPRARAVVDNVLALRKIARKRRPALEYRKMLRSIKATGRAISAASPFRRSRRASAPSVAGPALVAPPDMGSDGTLAEEPSSAGAGAGAAEGTPQAAGEAALRTPPRSAPPRPWDSPTGLAPVPSPRLSAGLAQGPALDSPTRKLIRRSMSSDSYRESAAQAIRPRLTPTEARALTTADVSGLSAHARERIWLHIVSTCPDALSDLADPERRRSSLSAAGAAVAAGGAGESPRTARASSYGATGATLRPLLRRLAWAGMPRALRGELWWRLGGLRACTSAGYKPDGSLYEELVAKHQNSTESWRSVIDLDVARTVQTQYGVAIERRDSGPLWGSAQSVTAGALTRVLVAVAGFLPHIGYCQGLNFLAFMFLRWIPNEERCFWTLVHTLTVLQPNDYYSNMQGAIADQLVLRELVRVALPRIADAITTLGGSGDEISLVVMRWFMCLFTASFDADVAARVLDTVFVCGSKALFRVVLTLLRAVEDDILAAVRLDDVLHIVSEVSIHLPEFSALQASMAADKSGSPRHLGGTRGGAASSQRGHRGDDHRDTSTDSTDDTDAARDGSEGGDASLEPERTSSPASPAADQTDSSHEAGTAEASLGVEARVDSDASDRDSGVEDGSDGHGDRAAAVPSPREVGALAKPRPRRESDGRDNIDVLMELSRLERHVTRSGLEARRNYYRSRVKRADSGSSESTSDVDEAVARLRRFSSEERLRAASSEQPLCFYYASNAPVTLVESHWHAAPASEPARPSAVASAAAATADDDEEEKEERDGASRLLLSTDGISAAVVDDYWAAPSPRGAAEGSRSDSP